MKTTNLPQCRYAERVARLFAFLLFATSWNVALSQIKTAENRVIESTNVKFLLNLADSLGKKASVERDIAVKKAIEKGWAVKTELSDSKVMELIRLDESGNPVYYITENANAAISTNVTSVRSGGNLGLSLEGTGMTRRPSSPAPARPRPAPAPPAPRPPQAYA
jgi:hypothetical protein